MIRVDCVAPEKFGDAWLVAGDKLLRGMHAAGMPIVGTMDEIKAGSLLLWLVSRPEPAEILGVFLTDLLRRRNGQLTVSVAALSGESVGEWASEMDAALVGYAKGAGAEAVRFIGRPGWARLIPALRKIDTLESGQVLFERPANV